MMMLKLVVVLLAAAACVQGVALSRKRRGDLTLAVSSSSAVSKQSSSSNGYEMEVDVGTRKVEIEASRELADGSEEEMSFELSTENYPKLEFEAELEGNGAETKDRLRVEFRRLVRFEPTDASLGYTAGDTIYEEYDLKDDATWNDIACTVPTGAADGPFACVVGTADNVFKLKATFSTASFIKNSETVTAKQCKIEIVVNMPLNGHPATSAVMLEAMMRTKSKFKPDEGSTQVSFGGAAIFEWEKFFTDELLAEYPVVTGKFLADTVDDGDEGEDDEDIVKTYTFAKAGVTSVNWDPVFGASGSSGSSSSLSTTQTIAVGAGVAALVAIVVIVAVVVMSKSKRPNKTTPTRPFEADRESVTFERTN